MQIQEFLTQQNSIVGLLLIILFFSSKFIYSIVKEGLDARFKNQLEVIKMLQERVSQLESEVVAWRELFMRKEVLGGKE